MVIYAAILFAISTLSTLVMMIKAKDGAYAFGNLLGWAISLPLFGRCLGWF